MDPEPWDFKGHSAADIVIINLGTNDNNTHNNVTSETFVSSYIKLITDVHDIWPKAQIVCMSLWNGFGQSGETWFASPAFLEEVPYIVKQFKGKGLHGNDFVH